MKLRFLILFVFLLLNNISISQSFTDTLNRWYVDDCGSGINGGNYECISTTEYYFTAPFEMDSKEYSWLITDHFFFNFNRIFREEGKRVYARELYYNTGEFGEEFLMYDFGLEVGDQTEVGDDNFKELIEVISVDSIQLYTGEKRKRLEIVLLNYFTPKYTYWIEGIGSELSPFDTRFMNTTVTDLFWELNCYLYNSEVAYSPKDCALPTSVDKVSANTELTVYPNPCSSGRMYLLSNNINEIELIEVYTADGQLVKTLNNISNNEIDINNLDMGIYFLRVGYRNSMYELIKFIKA